jgi:nucleotide-binding universal stress UspA family protein
MAPITEIVVPLDGSRSAERALVAAVPLAERLGATVLLLTSSVEGRGATPEELDRAAARCGVAPFTTVTIDDQDAVRAVESLARAREGRLVCLSSHGRSGPSRRTLGHVTEELIRTTAVNLLVVGRSCAPTWLDHAGPVLVCLDRHRAGEALAAAGCSWARDLDREAVLLSIDSPFDPVAEEQGLEFMRELCLARSAGTPSPAVTDVLSPHPSAALVTYAAEHAAVLMVVGPHHHTGHAGRHEVMRAVLAGAPCPVLVVPELAIPPTAERTGRARARQAR